MPAVDGVSLLRATDTPVKNSSGDTWAGIQTAVGVYWQLQGSYFRMPFGVGRSVAVGRINLAGETLIQTLPFPMVASLAPSSFNVSLDDTFNMDLDTPFQVETWLAGTPTDRDLRAKRALMLMFHAEDAGTFYNWFAEGDVKAYI